MSATFVQPPIRTALIGVPPYVRSSRRVYRRRRLAVVAVLATLCFVAVLSVRTTLADRGAVPASSNAIRHTSAVASSVAVPEAGLTTYLVQPGDTLWSIGQRFHGSVGVADYVDRLVRSHGHAALQIGELISLP